MNLPGNGDKTDEYTGVRPEANQTKDTNPDFYILGNVCEILDDLYRGPTRRIRTKTRHL